MATKVLVPLLGEGVEEVTVTKWLKKEGNLVDELEPLLEVNTDKVDTEIPAPASGTVLKILTEEGVPAKVGAVLAFIGKPGESVDSDKKPSNVESHTSNVSQTTTTLDANRSTEFRLHLSCRCKGCGRTWRELTAGARHGIERADYQE